MTVPLSEDEASRVPCWLIEMWETGDLCAWRMLVTERETASNKRMSPVVEVGVEEEGEGEEKGVVGEGSGDG